MPNPENAVATRLETDRKALLDLSLRNPLLNHRPRSRSLEVVGESPGQVVSCLVGEGRRMSFLPAPEPPPEPGSENDPTPSDETTLKAHPIASADKSDRCLQTTLSAEPLQARLLAIYYAARSSVEEQGVNTLFLALGMLEWRDEGRDGRRLRAPLVLVPVELERTSARERFRLRHNGEDIDANLSLSEKLRADFGVSLPDPPDSAEGDVDRYLDVVAEAVKDRPGWSVDRAAIVLGFFSFGRFLMYRDLDPAIWPEHARPSDHPILQALLRDGFHEDGPSSEGDDADLDRLAPVETFPQVVDADGSQTLVLLDVSSGRNLVIQGPPGTGKSQTITNLIAGALGRGRKVLFVAEKLAALEVVKRRLDAAGLGDACLELHSRNTSKRAVLEELARTYGLGRPRVADADDDLALLVESRDRLNAYCQALNEPIATSGISPYLAFGEMSRLREIRIGPLPLALELESSPNWTPFDRRRRLSLLTELQTCLAGLGLPRDHPFWGARRAVWPPTESERLRDVLGMASTAVDRLRAAGAVLARFLNVAEPGDRQECAALRRASHRVARSSTAEGIDLSSTEWLSRRGEIEEALAAGSALAALGNQYVAVLVPEAWDEDLVEARQTLNIVGRNWWRLASGSYRRARRRVDGLCRTAPPKTLDERLALADVVLAARRHRATIERHDSLAARLFARRWEGERSDWKSLAHAAKWVAKLHHDIRQRRLPAGLVEYLSSRSSTVGLGPLVERLEVAMAAHRDALHALTGLLEFDASIAPGGGAPVDARLFAAQSEQIACWLEHILELPKLVTFNQLSKRCRDEGLGEVVSLAEVWPEASLRLVAAVERQSHESLLRRAYAERPALASFDGPSHDRVVDRFRDLDRLALVHHRARLALAHWDAMPRRDTGGQLGVLRHEFGKKTRHLPVRQLMAKAGRAVQAVKPVFMMSPLSVASYLAPGSLEFDLVVFDEASQVRPVDALGAILRGKQVVVVGDSRQLPPTQFFDRLVSGDELDEASDDASTADLESILGLFVAQGAPERTLRWHYRSRHESLIAVSNREFYEDRLVVFPSPDADRRDAGLILRHLPETVYDRGGSRANPAEAEAVALAVMEHARSQVALAPEARQTLGVAAFSMAQTEAIRDRLEGLRSDDPTCEPFFAPGGPEPFFVKNLENVQGDERDVIYISVGYGRHAGGAVAMSFGPLNGEGGERRLNVLITRARIRCEVFTNLVAADIDLDRTRSRGVRALKTFLAYAESGRLPVTAAAATESLSPLERSVSAALERSGLRVRPRNGHAGFAPDLTVADPADADGRDVLALLGDGPAYQRARSVRDRDRLRPQILAALGWRVHRLWSAEWVRDENAALARVLDAVGAARPEVSRDPESPIAAEPAIPTIERDAIDGQEAPPSTAPAYQLARVNGDLDLGRAPVERIAARLVQVVGVEGPIHREEASRRVADGAGSKRIGARMLTALEDARNQAVSKGLIRERGDFLWPAAMDRPVVRDRSALPAASRRLELVAPEEIGVAVETVVADALGMSPDAIPAATCRLLGFIRTTDEMKAQIEAVVAGLVAEGRLVARGEHLLNGDPGGESRDRAQEGSVSCDD